MEEEATAGPVADRRKPSGGEWRDDSVPTTKAVRLQKKMQNKNPDNVAK